MDTIQNIFGMLILIIFIISIGFLIYSSNVESISSTYSDQQLKFIHQSHSNTFNTILSVHDSESDTTLSDLTVQATQEQKEVVNISGILINVSEKYYNILDKTYGIGNYYLSITPKVADVSLNFVIDGSSTLEDERQELADKLPSLIDTIKSQNGVTGENTIIANVYILGAQKNASDNACESIFKKSQNAAINCEYLGNVELYEKPETDSIIDIVDFNTYKIDYNIVSPYGSNEETVNSVRASSGGIEDYFEADWGAGVAHVSAKAKDSARLVLIFPMSDELSTSSIAQTCFTSTLIPGVNGDDRREQKVCDFCELSCSDPATVARALKSVKQGAEVAKDNNHVVYPIYAYTCDYPYNKVIFNAYFEDIFGEKPATTACNSLSCGGCSEDASGNVCFHPECEDTIIEQMEFLANETQGAVINLENIDELVNSVQKGILTTLNSFQLKVGEKKNRSKFVYTRSLILGNKLSTEIYLEVYYDYSEVDPEEYKKYFNVSYLDRRGPVITIYEPTESSVNIQNLTISGTAYDLSNISEVSYFCVSGCIDSGIANGTNIWNISSIVLKEGINVIDIYATDNAELKNKNKKTITITYVAPPKSCLDKDVHCIGIDKEYTTISSAIENGTGGDLFYIYDGVYMPIQTIIINKTLTGDLIDSTKFIGIGTNVILDGSLVNQDIPSPTILILGEDNLEKNILIEFENIEFENSAHIDIELKYTDSIKIKNNKFTNANTNNIFSSFSGNVEISKNEFLGTISGNCINLRENSNSHNIIDNTFSNCGSSTISIGGISENIFIEKNKITTSKNTVIEMISTQNSFVQNNVLFRNLGNGIVLENSNTNTIRHNTIYFEEGIEAAPLQIIDNSKSNSIYNNILISGNKNSNSYGAIEFDSSTISTQSNITNNVYYRDGSSSIITEKGNTQYTLDEFNSAFTTYQDTSINISSTENLFDSILDNDYELFTTSIALDKGIYNDLFYDIDMGSRPIGLGFDIGAYETRKGVIYPVSPTCEEVYVPFNPDDNVITLSPANASQFSVILKAAPSDTIIYLEDGNYDLSTNSRRIDIVNPRITLRSLSGDRDKVILDGKYAGKVSQILSIRADDITIADLTITRADSHPIHITGVDRTLVHNVKIIDGAEQFIKINTATYNGVLEFPDNGTVRCSHMELTPAGRPNVQNHGGNIGCYTGGVDMHAGWGWKFHDNVVKDIYCTNFNLAEHGFHLWRNVKDTVVERNILINNARGIGFGLSAGAGKRDYLPEDLDGTSFDRSDIESIGGIIRNNVIYSDIGKWADSAIALENSYNAEVYHNTIYMDDPDKAGIDIVYPNTIENKIKNNLIFIGSSKQLIRHRGGASAGNNEMEGNVDASSSMFASVAARDFTLRETAVDAINIGKPVGVSHDFDTILRDITPDIGAYEFK
jgi:parallel beta-helix repeat protein